MFNKTTFYFSIVLLLAGGLLAGCKKDISGCTNVAATNFNPNATKDDGSCLLYHIGQSYGGGTIFYLDATGKHGLIVAPYDQSAAAVWGNWPTTATAGAIGTGQANTNAIVLAGGPGNYAAYICDTLTLNGYNDWFLPSLGELTELLNQRNAGTVSGFYSDYYWSSTEYAALYAEAVGFCSCYQTYGTDKTTSFRVRAVRAF
jgi:hypothetical protein